MTARMSPALLGEELLKSFTVTGDRLKIEPRAAGQSEGCGGTTGLEREPIAQDTACDLLCVASRGVSPSLKPQGPLCQ